MDSKEFNSDFQTLVKKINEIALELYKTSSYATEASSEGDIDYLFTKFYRSNAWFEVEDEYERIHRSELESFEWN